MCTLQAFWNACHKDATQNFRPLWQLFKQLRLFWFWMMRKKPKKYCPPLCNLSSKIGKIRVVLRQGSHLGTRTCYRAFYLMQTHTNIKHQHQKKSQVQRKAGYFKSWPVGEPRLPPFHPVWGATESDHRGPTSFNLGSWSLSKTICLGGNNQKCLPSG